MSNKELWTRIDLCLLPGLRKSPVRILRAVMCRSISATARLLSEDLTRQADATTAAPFSAASSPSSRAVASFAVIVMAIKMKSKAGVNGRSYEVGDEHQ